MICILLLNKINVFILPLTKPIFKNIKIFRKSERLNRNNFLCISTDFLMRKMFMGWRRKTTKAVFRNVFKCAYFCCVCICFIMFSEHASVHNKPVYISPYLFNSQSFSPFHSFIPFYTFFTF